MAIKDAEFLRALSDMIDRANVQEKAILLTEEQKAMLAMSEDDIREGKTMDHFTVNERELEWLKRKVQIISPTNQFVSKARPLK